MTGRQRRTPLTPVLDNEIRRGSIAVGNTPGISTLPAIDTSAGLLGGGGVTTASVDVSAVPNGMTMVAVGIVNGNNNATTAPAGWATYDNDKSPNIAGIIQNVTVLSRTKASGDGVTNFVRNGLNLNDGSCVSIAVVAWGGIVASVITWASGGSVSVPAQSTGGRYLWAVTTEHASDMSEATMPSGFTKVAEGTYNGTIKYRSTIYARSDNDGSAFVVTDARCIGVTALAVA